MTYQRGDRVALEHTGDPHSRLRPGDEGTVRRYNPHLRVLDVDWDSGSRLSLLLDDGDRARRIPTPIGEAGWERVLDALGTGGAAAGRSAAEWWAQDVLGGRAPGDVRERPREILAGIDNGDPAMLDGLPVADRYALEHDADRYAEHAPPDAPAWEELTVRQLDEARWAWCDGFDGAAEAEVARQCRMILHPDGDDRDMSYLRPDRVGLGGPGVFAGEWAWTPNGDGDLRIPVGFAGTLVDTWKGWAVFTCTRQVAEAIVAEQQAARDRYRRQLVAQGIAGERLDRLVDQALARLWFDGDVIVADETRVHDDPVAIDRVAPDADGRYVVMGRSWTWTAVHPYDCDRIAGRIPDPPPQPTA
ncbi:DUF4314 domain-containing protein [Micromonospora sp. WMMC415]|uniref:DUF4314 domain-containing protein n=1 Tax=Micromonospora sp. WMMC415 TaxID=2675222 RepID=UPI0012B47F0F|nr:DUF4314 domain-containing protein [Micromonospora sp. WMMC415]QGN49793.1 DUF4314 domain-containing protein [Micromonospora sp. WMMC415]